MCWLKLNKHDQTPVFPLQWRHKECHDVTNHRHLNCLLSRLVRCTSKKTSKLCVTGLCEGNPPVTGGFPSQMASNSENVSIWWRQHMLYICIFVWYKSLEYPDMYVFRGNYIYVMIGGDLVFYNAWKQLNVHDTRFVSVIKVLLWGKV